MMFGVILNIFNFVHFGDYMDVLLIGVPQVGLISLSSSKMVTTDVPLQVLFLLLTFGYMDFLIVYKWLTNWNLSHFRTTIYNYQVPLLLNVMIQMFLSPWSVPDEDKV